MLTVIICRLSHHLWRSHGIRIKSREGKILKHKTKHNTQMNMDTDKSSDGQDEIDNEEPHIMNVTFDIETIPDASNDNEDLSTISDNSFMTGNIDCVQSNLLSPNMSINNTISQYITPPEKKVCFAIPIWTEMRPTENQ